MTTFDQQLTLAAPRALRAALGWLGDEQEAREATQEALLKAHRARRRYDPARPFYPWLRVIVRNTCFDRLARRKHRERSGLRDEWVAAEGVSALERLTRAEAVDDVRAAMATLSEAHREILVLRHFEDLAYAEIGEVLGIAQGTVMSRLYRARKALVVALEAKEEA